MSRSSIRTIVLWVVLITLFVAFFRAFNPPLEDVSWEEVQAAAERSDISTLTVRIERGQGAGTMRLTDGRVFHFPPQPMASFAELEKQGVPVVFRDEDSSLWHLLASWLPIAALFLFFVFFMRRMQARNPTAGVLSFDPAPTSVTETFPATFATEARQRLKEATSAARAGAARRIFVSGPPGSGKTRLIKAVAADAGMPLLAVAGSQVVEVMVGVGAARIRKLFEKAGQAKPCIVAIDDVDAFCTQRVPSDVESQVSERAATLLELVNQLDGLKPLPPGVTVMVTTSRPDLLDEALTRPGRFDLRVRLGAKGEAEVEVEAR
jgi:cell division protease FtsH